MVDAVPASAAPESPDAIPAAMLAQHPLATALTAQGVVHKEIALTVARYRFEFRCECGRACFVREDHSQHWCACGTLYTTPGVVPAAIEWRRGADGTGPRPAGQPSVRTRRRARAAQPAGPTS